MHAMTRHVKLVTTPAHIHALHIHLMIGHVSIIRVSSLFHSHLVLLLSGLLCRNEVHAAFWTLPRLVLLHLWMHWTGIRLDFLRLWLFHLLFCRRNQCHTTFWAVSQLILSYF